MHDHIQYAVESLNERIAGLERTKATVLELAEFYERHAEHIRIDHYGTPSVHFQPSIHEDKRKQQEIVADLARTLGLKGKKRQNKWGEGLVVDFEDNGLTKISIYDYVPPTCRVETVTEEVPAQAAYTRTFTKIVCTDGSEEEEVENA